MFKWEENLPSVYIKESRDFQMLSRLNTLLDSGIRYDIASMTSLLDAISTNDDMLVYISNRLGFAPRRHIDNKILRYILAAFSVAVKNKGSKLGIEQAVIAILKAESSLPDNANFSSLVEVTNSSSATPYNIDIYVVAKYIDRVGLDEFLRYIIPAGYTYKVHLNVNYKSTMQGSEFIYGASNTTVVTPNRAASVVHSQKTYAEMNDENYPATTITKSSNIDTSYFDSIMGSVYGTTVISKEDMDNKNTDIIANKKDDT